MCVIQKQNGSLRLSWLVYCVIDIFDHDHDHDHEKNIVLNHDHEFFSNDNHDHDHDHEILCSYNHDHDHDHDFFTIFSRLYHECYIVFRDTRKIFSSHICGAKWRRRWYTLILQRAPEIISYNCFYRSWYIRYSCLKYLSRAFILFVQKYYHQQTNKVRRR
jgi:hypothetical protein